MTAFNQSCLATNSPTSILTRRPAKLCNGSANWVYPGASQDIAFSYNLAWNNGPANVASLVSEVSGVTFVTDASAALLFRGANDLTFTNNGLEVFQAATNGFLQSDDLSNAAWFSGGQNPTVVSTGNAAPDGTPRAVRITFGSGSAAALRQAVAVTNNQPVVMAFYVKRAPSSSATNIRICTNNGGAWNTGGDAVLALTNSWQRIPLTFQNTFGNGVAVYLGAQKSDITEDATCKGDALVCFGDFTANSTIVTPHISTTTGAATRSAAVPKMTLAGTSTGGILVSAVAPATFAADQYLFEWSDDTTNNRLAIYVTTNGNLLLIVVSGGVVQVNNMVIGALTLGAAFKVAVRWRAGSFGASLNGAAEVVQSSGSVPTGQTVIRFGAYTAGNYWNSTINRFTVYPNDSITTTALSAAANSASAGAASLVRQTVKILTALTLPVVSLVRQIGKAFQPITFPLARLLHLIGKSFSCTAPGITNVVLRTGKPLFPTTAPIAAQVRVTAKITLATSTAAATLSRAMARSMIASCNNTVFATRYVIKYLVRAVTIVGALTFVRRIISKPRLRALFGNPTLRGEID